MREVTRILDALSAYKDEPPVSGQARDFYYVALRNALEGVEPDIFLPIELDGVVWTLFVVGDGVRLIRLDDGAVEIRFLGPLRGCYSESWKASSGPEFHPTFRFADERLPGGFIELEQPPSRVPGTFPEDETIRRAAEIAKLRPLFRTWSEVPPAAN